MVMSKKRHPTNDENDLLNFCYKEDDDIKENWYEDDNVDDEYIDDDVFDENWLQDNCLDDNLYDGENPPREDDHNNSCDFMGNYNCCSLYEECNKLIIILLILILLIYKEYLRSRLEQPIGPTGVQSPIGSKEPYESLGEIDPIAPLNP